MQTINFRTELSDMELDFVTGGGNDGGVAPDAGTKPAAKPDAGTPPPKTETTRTWEVYVEINADKKPGQNPSVGGKVGGKIGGSTKK